MWKDFTGVFFYEFKVNNVINEILLPIHKCFSNNNRYAYFKVI